MPISAKPVSDFDAAVRLLSGGTNIVIYNDLGLPSIFVRRDKGMISDVITGGSSGVHPAFIVDGVEKDAFYIGKYLACVYKGRALSLPLQDPTVSSVAAADRGSALSTSVDFDNAKIWCESNGPGFHLPTIAEYAWLALLSRKNGTMPRGNNNYGQDHSAAWGKGIVSYYYDSSGTNTAGRTLTGSGPATWNDNWKPDGICDLNGNVYEWQGGYRTVDGEIQIFPDNNAAMQLEQNAASTLWKAILQDGTLVDTGTDGSLKWDYVNEVPAGAGSVELAYMLNTIVSHPADSDSPYGAISFASLTAAEGVDVPERLITLALMPEPGAGNTYGSDRVYMRNRGERLVFRGGIWRSTSDAGVFCAIGSTPRSNTNSSIGFRPAFIPDI